MKQFPKKLKIKKNVVLAPYTTYKIGGPAKYFFETANEKEIVRVLKFCQKNKIPYFILGGGSNVLFSDKGFDGLVIKIQDTKYKIQDTYIEAGAAMSIAKLIAKTKEKNLSGAEYLAGLPGTLGGAIFGNAGSTRSGKEIKDLIYKAELLFPRGKIKKVNNNWFKFSYRHSYLKELKNNDRPIILKAVLKLKRDTKENIEKRIKEINTMRSQRLPCGFSAGCVFKNVKIMNLPPPQKIWQKDTQEYKDFVKINKQLVPWDIIKGNEEKGYKIPTAWFIDQCGLKGKKIGGARISKEHANFIINENNAKAADVIALMKLARKKVKEKFNIDLEDENILVEF
jgi:UDP-N-acetylmuramate dehydrogenase